MSASRRHRIGESSEDERVVQRPVLKVMTVMRRRDWRPAAAKPGTVGRGLVPRAGPIPGSGPGGFLIATPALPSSDRYMFVYHPSAYP